MTAQVHEQWSSKLGFILAAIGGAVGLGNIWKFPYVTGENGGGAFVIIYLVAALCVALPILISELYLGKRGHKGPISGTIAVARDVGASTKWSAIGWLGVGAAFLVLTFYSMIAGWAVDYMIITFGGAFNGLDPVAASDKFDELRSSPLMMTFWHTIFMIITIFIVARGVTAGIEKSVKIMMPAFFVMLLGMLGYSIFAADFAAGWDYMFTPDWSKVKPQTFLAAIGQAFFSIGISFGYMLAYGAYLPKDVNIPKTSVIITLADTGVAIVAGLVIFPIVFANGLNPAEGPDLIFRVLPTAFAQMTGGQFLGGTFFLLLVFAALSSSIAILQPAVAYLEESHDIPVMKSTLIAAGLAWFLGLGSVLSFNEWADFYPMEVFGILEGKTFMGVLEYATDNIMMPLGGILISLFVGWKISESDNRGEFEGISNGVFKFWLFLTRFVAPAAVAVIMIMTFIG